MMIQLVEQQLASTNREPFKDEWLITSEKRNQYQHIYSIEHLSSPNYKFNWYLGPMVMDAFSNILPDVCSIYQDSITEITIILYSFDWRGEKHEENVDFNQLTSAAIKAIRGWYIEKQSQHQINPHFLDVFS